MERPTLSNEFYDDFKMDIVKTDETDMYSTLKTVLERIEKYSMESSNDEYIDDLEYECITQSNSVVLNIDEEIIKIQKSLQEIYSKQFPELEKQLYSPLDYARVVIKIKDSNDISGLNMFDFLPNATILAIKMIYATTKGKGLSTQDLKSCMDLAEKILLLDQQKSSILSYISSRMTMIAPNLSAIVGTDIAAQLIGAAGGLKELMMLPGGTVQILGKEKKLLNGFSTKSVVQHVGFIGNCDLVKNAPPDYRKKIARIVSMKAALACRVDFGAKRGSGSQGKEFRKEIEESIEKMMEAPPAKQEKPLPIPDEPKKKKRGGRMSRIIKQKYAPTVMREKMNRVVFGVAEKEIGDTGMGMGMLGVEGSGTIRIKTQNKVKTKSWDGKGPKQQVSGLETVGIQTSGFATTVPGVEFLKPKEKKDEKYFSNLEFKSSQSK